MKKIVLLSLIFMTAMLQSPAQFSRYVIQLKNKTGTPFSISQPAQFLSQRAIDRRTRYRINIEQNDLPITPAYVDSIRLAGNVTILNVSKWFNQVCIQTTDASALSKINGFTFVQNAAPVAVRIMPSTMPVNKPFDPPIHTSVLPITARPMNPAGYYDYGQSLQQVQLNNTQFLHNLGFRGKGMQMAILDAGFYHYQSLPTFDSIRNNQQILGTWDFVNNEASVDEDHYHGMQTLSTIAANLPGTFVGTAPQTAFYLYRTEDAGSEYPIEENNWAAAAEQADSAGADIFSVSLGYNTFDNSSLNHTYADMNGRTTTISKAANIAARKGILVACSAGNDGNAAWHYIGSPADADSVLTVGAVNINRQVASFSSYGPSSDGQIKPDVAAVGANAVVANTSNGAPSFNNGTSFSCPITAGLVTCLWQAFPEVSNMQIIATLRQSADQFNTPDDRTGYGIADAKKAFVLLIKQLYQQQIFIDNSCKTAIQFAVKSAEGMTLFVERKLPLENNYTTIFTQDATGIFSTNDYNFADDLHGLPGNMAIRYRIKMSIGSDTSFYVDSATVNLINPCTLVEDIQVSPNPVSDELSVSIVRNEAVNVAIELFAINGQKVYSQKIAMQGGTQLIKIPTRQLSKGIYFVTVFINNKSAYTKKILRD